jgi:hypothetical protein
MNPNPLASLNHLTFPLYRIKPPDIATLLSFTSKLQAGENKKNGWLRPHRLLKSP